MSNFGLNLIKSIINSTFCAELNITFLFVTMTLKYLLLYIFISNVVSSPMTLVADVQPEDKAADDGMMHIMPVPEPAFHILPANDNENTDEVTNMIGDFTPYVPIPECEYETPEDQFKRVSANGKKVDFNAYNEMVDRCGMYYRKKEFDRIDVNHDGEISQEEWDNEQARIKKEIEKSNERFRNETFMRFDQDNNGEIDLKEFRKFLNSWGRQPKNAKNFLSNYNGTLNIEEFGEVQNTLLMDVFPIKPFRPLVYHSKPNIKIATNNRKKQKNQKINSNQVMVDPMHQSVSLI